MAVDYRFKKQVDLPSWHWLSPTPPGAANYGTCSAYDGSRYIYWLIQYGTTTGGTASTCALWAYDTWTNGWQALTGALTNANRGADIEYDPVRNVLWIMFGASSTEWRYFNLNTSAITLAGLTTNPWTISSAIATVLPAAPNSGASFSMLTDVDLADPIDTGTAGAGSTTTTIVASAAKFVSPIVGLQIRFTAGAASGQKRIITGVTNSTTLTVSRAFANAPAAGDAWVIECPTDTTVSATVSTLVTLGGLGTTNQFANQDVVIVSGTGAGQRRRIGSNDGTTLTLATTVTGNPRTGNWTTTPDATSVYRIVPSSDFLYFMNANGNTTFYKIDVVATTLAWSSMAALPGASGAGGNLLRPRLTPFRVLAVRGNGSNNLYMYDPGTNTWLSLNISAFAAENLNEGAATCLMGSRRKLFVQIQSSPRCLIYDLITGAVDPATFLPYASPGAHDGKRARYIQAPSGVEWIYLVRAAGQEFYRIPLEWLDA